MIVFLEKAVHQASPESLLDTYGEIFFLLADRYNTAITPVGNSWQDHLLELILYQSNPFSEAAAAVPFEQLGGSLKQAAAWDLQKLQVLYTFEASTVLDLLNCPESTVGRIPDWGELSPRHHEVKNGSLSKAKEIKALLAAERDWRVMVKPLADYYYRAGAGIFGKYGALRWVSREERLEGIALQDQVRLEDLIGYQAERQEIIDNTERFLAGLPANNILLYGDRGTGKSSTVKALLNRYQERGLRLVEVPKSALRDYPKIIRVLRDKPQRFILFLDDLSFEDNEYEYKELKAVMEGGLEVRPDNILIYATSNRRHLVREHFSDRETAGNGEVRAGDTVQEKLSLADRFGLVVLFTMPDRSLYLDIVHGLARQRGIALAADELDKQALLWAAYHNGFSGRTARQFIDAISGQ